MGEKHPVEYTLVGQGSFERGKRGAEKRKLISDLLGELGLSAAFQPTEQFEAKQSLLAERQPDFRFTDLTSPESYVVREHIENLQLLDPTLATGGRGSVIRAFHSLIDHGRNSAGLHDGSRKIRPRKNIHPVRREELQIPEYVGQLPVEGKAIPLSVYAVQSGEIVDYAESLTTKPEPDISRNDRVLIAIADRLQEQFV